MWTDLKWKFKLRIDHWQQDEDQDGSKLWD